MIFKIIALPLCMSKMSKQLDRNIVFVFSLFRCCNNNNQNHGIFQQMYFNLSDKFLIRLLVRVVDVYVKFRNPNESRKNKAHPKI